MSNAELREFCTQMIGKFKLLSDIQKEMQYETIDAKFTEWELKKLIFALNVLREEVRKYVDTADTPQTDCNTCRYGQDKHRYAHICNECGVGINNYTPQTDIPSRDELGDCNSCEYLGDLRCGMCTNGSGYRRADTPQTEAEFTYCPRCGMRILTDTPQTDCGWK